MVCHQCIGNVLIIISGAGPGTISTPPDQLIVPTRGALVDLPIFSPQIVGISLILNELSHLKLTDQYITFNLHQYFLLFRIFTPELLVRYSFLLYGLISILFFDSSKIVDHKE